MVRVTLLNRGSDAFQHSRYGDYITVERRIERNGSAGYRLLKGDPNHQDRLELVSRSKEDLDTMLDLFNIQVKKKKDMPLLVYEAHTLTPHLLSKTCDYMPSSRPLYHNRSKTLVRCLIKRMPRSSFKAAKKKNTNSLNGSVLLNISMMSVEFSSPPVNSCH